MNNRTYDLYNRKKTNTVRVADISIGGDSPISVQSMTTSDTRDAKATIYQIDALVDSGCEIVRVAVPDMRAAQALGEIKRNIKIPLVADIHFDHRLAIEAIEQGVDKIRINPGNIGSIERTKLVVSKAKERSIPIRIGVNSGSLEQRLIEHHGGVTPAALVESALGHVRILEDLDFGNIVISLKATSVPFTLAAYRMISERTSHPLHVGITESGTLYSGTIKSTAGIASLLSLGIGDTLRVSLTADPVEEVRAAREILQSMELRVFGPTLISCPTCGRTEIELIPMAQRVEEYLAKCDKKIKVAVMGCVVNGPGEAREADIGIAGGKGSGILFKKGQIIAAKVPEEKLLDLLFQEIENM